MTNLYAYELSDRAWNAGTLNASCAISAADELRRLCEGRPEFGQFTVAELIARANELDPDGTASREG